MNELTDDQLDGLFRKSAEEFEPPFDAAAWQMMRLRLDNFDQTGSTLRNRLVSWGLPLLFLFLLTGAGWTGQQNREATFLQATAIGATPEQTVIHHVLPRTGQKSQHVNQVTASLNTRAAATSREETRTEPSIAKPTGKTRSSRTETKQMMTLSDRSARPGQKKTLAKAYPTELMTDDVPTAAATTKSTSAGRTPFRLLNPDWTPEPITAEVASVKIAVLMSDTLLTVPTKTDELNLLAMRSGQWPSSFQFTNRPVASEPETTPYQPRTAMPVSERGLSVRIVVSPDLSAVGLHNFARPGTNVGAMLEHRLAPRWSVQAGLLRSMKVYNAQLSDYTWTGKRWAVMPEDVDGRCVMLDIPLNLRYDFVRHSRTNGQQPDRWFVSGGATTYVILNEDYTYNYAWPDNPAIKFRNWRVDSTSRYGFSQLNLSVGFERTFSRRLSWQVEPFIKLPLKGVGFYKINLLSTGAFLSLRYKL